MGGVFAHQFDSMAIYSPLSAVQSSVLRAIEHVDVALVADRDCGTAPKDLGICIDNKGSFAAIGPNSVPPRRPFLHEERREFFFMERCPRAKRIRRIT